MYYYRLREDIESEKDYSVKEKKEKEENSASEAKALLRVIKKAVKMNTPIYTKK